MAKSRRTKLVSLTKTRPQRRGAREQQLRRMQAGANDFGSVYVLAVGNMGHENQALLRRALPGRLLFGKKSFARRFFANRAEAGAELVAEFLDAGAPDQLVLLFSDAERAAVQEALEALHGDEYGRAGSLPTATLRLSAGADALRTLPLSAEEPLRALGLDIDVAQGRIQLLRPFDASVRGQPLTAVQARLLRMLGVKVAEFGARALGVWERGAGAFTLLAA